MPARKKVVFAINNLGMGGAENMLVEQVRFMDRKLFDLYIITILPNQNTNVFHKIPQDAKLIEFRFSSLFDFSELYKVWSFLRREKIYAVVTSLFDANLLIRIAAVLARTPVILSSEVNVYEHKKKWQIVADRILARFTKKILVSSNEVLDFTSKQESLSKSKFALNFNAIPLKFGGIKRERDRILGEYNLPPEQIYIATAGSLTPQKGQKYLVDAVYELKNKGVRGFKVLIFGKGVLKEELLAQIEKLNLTKEIQLMGIVPIEDILAISDIFTLPSLWEGLSIALLEAMDAECAIVATKVSGTNEALENEISALLVTPGDSLELAEAYNRLLYDDGLRVELANKAKEMVKKFSIEKNVRVIENLILPSYAR